jgi:hypothetical protein
MSSFLEGWKCLPLKLQAGWMKPSAEDNDPGGVRSIFTWFSWTSWVYKSQNLVSRKEKTERESRNNTKFPEEAERRDLIRTVVARMPHEGLFLDMPPTPAKEASPNLSRENAEIRETLAAIVIDQFFAEVRSKSTKWVGEKIESEGVAFLKPLLNKKNIFNLSEKVYAPGEDVSDYEAEDTEESDEDDSFNGLFN